LELKTASIYFPSSVINDIQSAKALRNLALAIMQSKSVMEVEERWFDVCQILFARHVDVTKEPKKWSILPHRIKLAREILDCNLTDNLSLSSLADSCNISPFHLTRSFSAHFGLPPHAYHLQKRVEHAKTLIRKGETLANVATATGFADQAHMARHFRKYLGAPPGQFGVKNFPPNSPLMANNSKNVQYDK
jgi:AraC-like DNA-binding protein